MVYGKHEEIMNDPGNIFEKQNYSSMAWLETYKDTSMPVSYTTASKLYLVYIHPLTFHMWAITAIEWNSLPNDG